MKWIANLLVICFISMGSLHLKAQEDVDTTSYYYQMKSNLYTLYKAGNVQTFKLISKRIEKLAEEKKTGWIPYYHASYGYIMAAFLSKEKFEIEDFLNTAQNLLDKAKKLNPGSEEIVALQGFLYQARINVDPQTRMVDYVQKAVKEYDKARFINPDNPRPYYLIGQLLYRLPVQLGQNKENACKHFVKAAERFESFQPKGEFSPNWGKEANEKMLENCY